MNTSVVFAIYLLLLILAPCANAQETTPKLTNEDVVKMVQAGLSTDLIMTKIKKSETNFDTSPSALAGLPKRGVPNEILLAMLETDPLGSNTNLVRKNGKRITAAEFHQLQTSVLTVWSEFGSGTGFIVDEMGLVLTSQHIIGRAEYIAVQIDSKRKLPARLLAADPDKDVAVLWINLAAIPDASVAPMADPDEAEPSIAAGERVLTMGGPLNERKVFTTGIASKVDRRSIVSDINLNRADSGGPLFNSVGEAVGIATFLHSDADGPEVYGILRIEQTFPLIAQATKRMKRMRAPAAKFLPVEPSEPFPLDAIKTIATAKNFDMQRYSFDVGEFGVLVMTPAVRYRLATAAQRDVSKSSEVKTFEELKNWAGYLRGDKPVVFIYAVPRSNDSFREMHLFCGEREVEPIHPAKIAPFATAKEVTFRGIYAYPPRAISADCEKVTLKIYSEGNPYKARTRELDRKVVTRVDEEFSPYYQKYGRPPLTLLDPPPPDNTITKRKNWWEFKKPPKQR